MQYWKVRIKDKQRKIVGRRVILNHEQYAEIDLEVSIEQMEENYEQVKEQFNQFIAKGKENREKELLGFHRVNFPNITDKERKRR